MKRLSLACTLCASLISAPLVMASDSGLPLAAFGADGNAVPKIAYELLPADFFSQPMTGALAAGDNHVATITGAQLAGARGARTLSLSNPNGYDVDIVLSAASERGAVAHNFLVRVEAGAEMRLDLTDAAGAENVYVLSLLPFTATFGGAGLDVLPAAALVAEELAAAPATKIGGSTCPIIASRTVQVCNSLGCVTGRARHRLLPYDPYDPNADPHARGSVQYPVGTSFHCSNGTSPVDLPVCSASGYATRRCDGTPYTHYWAGLDDTIQYCIPSYAYCTSGCTGSFSVSC